MKKGHQLTQAQTFVEPTLASTYEGNNGGSSCWWSAVVVGPFFICFELRTSRTRCTQEPLAPLGLMSWHRAYRLG